MGSNIITIRQTLVTADTSMPLCLVCVPFGAYFLRTTLRRIPERAAQAACVHALPTRVFPGAMSSPLHFLKYSVDGRGDPVFVARLQRIENAISLPPCVFLAVSIARIDYMM